MWLLTPITLFICFVFHVNEFDKQFPAGHFRIKFLKISDFSIQSPSWHTHPGGAEPLQTTTWVLHMPTAFEEIRAC